MIPKIIYTAHLQEGEPPAHLAAVEAAWKQHHPDWEHVRFTLDDRPVVLNAFEWENAFELPEPAGAASRLNILRYEVLARFGGVFIEPCIYPLRPIDELLDNVSGFCSSVGGYGKPHQLSSSILGAERNHPAMWHALRDLPRSVYTYRGVWDQTGPGLLSRVIDDRGHFRHWVVFHWALFNLSRDKAEQSEAAFAYVEEPSESESSTQ